VKLSEEEKKFLAAPKTSLKSASIILPPTSDREGGRTRSLRVGTKGGRGESKDQEKKGIWISTEPPSTRKIQIPKEDIDGAMVSRRKMKKGMFIGKKN